MPIVEREAEIRKALEDIQAGRAKRYEIEFQPGTEMFQLVATILREVNADKTKPKIETALDPAEGGNHRIIFHSPTVKSKES